jgi:hypothetical protein
MWKKFWRRAYICVLRARLANDDWKQMPAISILVEIPKGGGHAVPQVWPSEPASSDSVNW